MAQAILETIPNIIELKPAPGRPSAKPRQAIRRNTRAARALRRQAGTAVGLGLVALTLTALSLSHLAHGIEGVTGCEAWEGWAMAVGIDLGFVGLELAQLAVGERIRRQITRYARPAILGTLAGSAGMNAFAFGGQAANGYLMAAGIALGVAIPTLIYCLTQVVARIARDCHTRH
jgi:hypothetical protein